MIQLCNQIIHQDLGRTYYKMSFSEKINAINDKIEQSKAQCNLTGRRLRFLLYHQEMLVNRNF